MNLLEKIQTGVYVIAEMSANHAGVLENALKIVRAAKESGADCLKIQTYTADSLTIDCDNEYFQVKGGLWDGYNLYQLYNEAATPYEWQPKIKEECARIGIDFLSTPFDEKGVDFLEALDVQAYKVASFELVHIPLLKYIARKGKPMIVSCGSANKEEIGEAVEAMTEEGLSKEQIILLKCTAEYPAKFQDMNLLTIPEMERTFGCRVGFSDHSLGSLASTVAVAVGACLIEKHFCLSRAIKNPDSEFSMEPQEFAAMVSDVQNVVKLLGNEPYRLSESEKSLRASRRSLFVVKDVKEGEFFTTDNVRCIRPGQGFAPKYFDKVLGKKAASFIESGTPLHESLAEGSKL